MHVVETCIESVVGVASQFLFVNVIIVSLLTPHLTDGIEPSGVVIFYGLFAISTLFCMIFFLKDTTYTTDEDGKRRNLTDRKKKNFICRKNSKWKLSFDGENKNLTANSISFPRGENGRKLRKVDLSESLNLPTKVWTA